MGRPYRAPCAPDARGKAPGLVQQHHTLYKEVACSSMPIITLSEVRAADFSPLGGRSCEPWWPRWAPTAWASVSPLSAAS